MLLMMRRHFSFAGVAAVAALVFAMSGGAWAAKKYLITSTAQISPSVLKKLKGAAGPAGQAGAVGGQGAQGKDGAQGASGKPGEPGPKGPEGSPWTAGGTLPSGATETGAFTMVATEGASLGSVSFAIPLAAPLPEEGVHAIKAGGTVPAACDDGKAPAPSPAKPEADPGNLCVFVESELEALIFKTGTPLTEAGAGRTGAQLASFEAKTTTGTWAVTAP